MYVAATLESLLLNAANSSYKFENGLPEDLKIYEKDLKLDRLTTQLQMLPDLINLFLSPFFT